MQVIPIASGKGGVGKSLVATNLAIALAQAGKKTVITDLDLGASNVHLILGMGPVKEGIGNVLNSKKKNIEDIILDTEYKNLRFVPGDAEIPGMANLKTYQKKTLIRQLHSLDADYLIIDLGAGTSYNTIDFFLSSGKGIIVTTPTLTATLNAYLFLKNSVFRILDNSFHKDSPIISYLQKLKQDGSALQRLYLPKFLGQIEEKDPEGYDKFQEKLSHFRPMLIMNMLEDPKDSGKASKIRRSCREYLGVDLEHLGIIYRDHLQDVALSSRLPILIYKPQTVLSQAIYRITDKILQHNNEEEGPLDFENLDNSYLAAEMEAEIDFDTKVTELESLLHSGSLTKGDLIETVKSQQFELSRLKRENNLLKARIVKAIKAGFDI